MNNGKLIRIIHYSVKERCIKNYFTKRSLQCLAARLAVSNRADACCVLANLC